jgi:diaminohydroxyphosphoribosylaminopyrimidine deaminase/5-amino-6-(5-phosphoribosylamino)uracil reductase
LIHFALALASAASTKSSPNPAVGCVLVSRDQVVLGQGHTQPVGGPHAEVMALRDATERGLSVVGATAYVTLEPCSHHGRTGPCCDALIAAGISKVVATAADPNPLVSGKGFARLRAAGITVEVLPALDPLAVQSRELNIGFFSRMIRKSPWVRMKIAASLDGKTALLNGVSQWITSTEARADGHQWRARSCAILTGIGTVLKDDPRLDVRLDGVIRQPNVVVVDSALQTPCDARLFANNRKVLIYTASQDDDRTAALRGQGALIVHMPEMASNGSHTGRVDLKEMLEDLGEREVNELHVEAGHTLNGELARCGLVDELVVYFAPKCLGQGTGMMSFGPLTDLTGLIPLTFLSTTMVGPDLRILARLQNHDLFLTQ